MDGTSIVKLAADLAVGAITADQIKDHFGEGVLSSVLAIGGGAVAGIATQAALSLLDEHTGIVSDVGGLVDDFMDLF
jgi:uncharacterized membrane protein YeiH